MCAAVYVGLSAHDWTRIDLNYLSLFIIVIIIAMKYAKNVHPGDCAQCAVARAQATHFLRPT